MKKKKKQPFSRNQHHFFSELCINKADGQNFLPLCSSSSYQPMPVEFSSERSHSSCGLSLWLADVSGSLANKDIFETVCAASDSGDLSELVFLLCQVFISHQCRRVLHRNVCIEPELGVILGLVGPVLCVHWFQEGEIAGVISPGM